MAVPVHDGGAPALLRSAAAPPNPPVDADARSLSAYDIVRLCEWGRDKHALDRAIVLLRAASPGAEPEALARLPIGRRDARLLALRVRTFGSSLELSVRCPACTEALEFTMRAEDITVPPPGDGLSGTLSHGGFSLDYRLPDSLDLAAVAGVRDPLEARNRLLQRCIQGAVRLDGEEGGSVPLSAVPEGVLVALAERLATDDPQADVTFRLRCQACRHEWVSPFDVLTFFWSELEAHARQLQREVHGIARLYGWTEPYILAMGAARRAHYLELARGD